MVRFILWTSFILFFRYVCKSICIKINSGLSEVSFADNCLRTECFERLHFRWVDFVKFWLIWHTKNASNLQKHKEYNNSQSHMLQIFYLNRKTNKYSYCIEKVKKNQFFLKWNLQFLKHISAVVVYRERKREREREITTNTLFFCRRLFLLLSVASFPLLAHTSW